jgi:hypothetical protein
MLQHFSPVSLALQSIRHSFRPETFPAPSPRSERCLTKAERALQVVLEAQQERIRLFTIAAHIRLSACLERSEEECWHLSHLEGLTCEAELLLTSRLLTNHRIKRVLRNQLISEAERCTGNLKTAQAWIAIVEYDVASQGTVRETKDLLRAMKKWSSN